MLTVGVRQAQEIQEIRVTRHQVGRQPILFAKGGKFLPCQFGRFTRQSRPLIKQALNLGMQCADAPALEAAYFCVKVML